MLVGGQPVKNTCLSVLLGCTPACQQLGCSMLACWHAGMLACWYAGRWPVSEEGGHECWAVCAAGVHPSMPASPVVGMLHVGMLAYWLMASQRGMRAKNVGMSVLLGCFPASQTYQHPCRWHAGMLVGGQPVKSTNLSVLLGCNQACRQLGGNMLAYRHAGMLSNMLWSMATHHRARQ